LEYEPLLERAIDETRTVKKMEGYRGMDIKLLCNEGVYNMVRELNLSVADEVDEVLEGIKNMKGIESI
jgi:hypothetical protein